MGAISTLSDEAYRDFAVPGVPASGAHDPEKVKIRAIFSAVDAATSSLIEGLIIGNAVVYAARATLYADLAHGAGVLGVVYNDATEVYNGVYVKAGSSGAGSWSLTALALPSSFGATISEVVSDLGLKADRATTIAPGGLLVRTAGDGTLGQDQTLSVPKATGSTVVAGADDSTAITPLALKQASNVPNGLSRLDASGRVPTASLPDSLAGSLNYRGPWNAATNSPAIPSPASSNRGWFYVVAVAGSTSIGGIGTWNVGDQLISDGTTWTRIESSKVNTVAGRFGDVTLTKSDVGLANVDNKSADTIKNELLSSAGTWSVAQKFFAGTVFAKESSGSVEGGQFYIERPDVTDLEADVVFDIYENKLRVFVNAGGLKGASLDLSAMATGVGSRILTDQDLDAIDVVPYATLALASAAAVAAGKRLRMRPGTYTVAADATLAADFEWSKGALVNVNAGVTLRITGRIPHDTYGQLFTGAGSVVGLRYVRAEWFGAKADYNSGADTGTDDAGAIQKAVNCVQDAYGSKGGRPTVEFVGADYRICSSIVIRPTFNCPIYLKGQGFNRGTRFWFDGRASAFNAGLFLQPSAATSPTIINDWRLEGFYCVSLGGVSVGCQIGELSANYFSGLKHSLIEDVVIEGFPTNWKVINTRMIAWNRSCGINAFNANTINLHVLADGNYGGGFSGDMVFTGGCQLWSNFTSSANRNVLLETVNNGGIHGLRFNDTVAYYGGISFEMRATRGNIGDIWLNSMQFDGDASTSNGGRAIYGSTNHATSEIYNIRLGDFYARGWTGAYCVRFERQSSLGRIYGISVGDPWLGNVWGYCLDFKDVVGLSIGVVQVYEGGYTKPQDAAVRIDNCQYVNVQGLEVDEPSGNSSYNYGIRIQGGSDDFTVAGVHGSFTVAPVYDTSSGGTKTILTSGMVVLMGKAVSYGANDSGGSGYKVLRVPN